MKRLPAAKRNQLVLAIIGTVALISIVYFCLIHPQNDENAKLAAKTNTELARLELMKNTVKQSDLKASAAAEISTRLSQAEADVATGDVFAWTYDTIRQFKSGYKVEIPTVGQPVQSDVDMIRNFPYKQIKFSIMGIGYYHDLGKFIADFENKFPHMRVVNMTIDSASGGLPEKLSFRMEILALVKPNA